MATSLFSVYSQRENRVTASFLAVLERLSLPNMDRILQALLDDENFRLVRFENQPKGKSSTPDAKINTSPAILIETKTSENSVNHYQISQHLKSLEGNQKLLLLTPDDSRPSCLNEEVRWSNFITLSEAIKAILNDADEPASEREAFLLRELIRLLRDQGLLVSFQKRVLVFPAPAAWPMYRELSVYRRAVGKSFRKSGHLGFYANGEIKPIVPKIKSEILSIDLRNQEAINLLEDDQKKLAEELKRRIDATDYWHEFSQAFHLMFLSEADDEETIKLGRPVKNDKRSKSGKGTAFTQSFTYVNIDSLKEATKTSELARA